MRLALGHIDSYTDTVAAFAQQLGLSGVQFHTPDNLQNSGDHWSLNDLIALHDRARSDGLTVEGIENVPISQFWKIQRGTAGRDEQIDHYRRTIQNVGRAGFRTLGHNFMPTYVWRTDMHATGRGGARVSAFDLKDVVHGNALATHKLSSAFPLDDPLSAEQMWSNYEYFLDATLPVAEEEGVQLALHPDDPPVDDPLGGAARIFTSPAALRTACELSKGSPAWGLNFCLGTVSEMGGQAAVFEVIDTLGAAGKIAYVHFRDVVGTVPRFREAFLGEGNFDPAAVLRRHSDVGFDGFLIDDHVPAMVGDIDTWGDTSGEAYCSRGRAHAIGYLQGILSGLTPRVHAESDS